MGYIYIAKTLLLTVYGQIVLKWQLGLACAMPKFQLSKPPPFMALNFVLVALVAVPLFGEAVPMPKAVGMAPLVNGLIALSQG